MVNKILKIINLICIKLSDINFNKQYNFKYICDQYGEAV